MADTDTFLRDSFSVNAADAIRLRRALYGPLDAQALILRCFKRSKAGKVNESTVWNCWQEQDDELDAAAGFDAPAERQAAIDAFVQGQK